MKIVLKHFKWVFFLLIFSFFGFTNINAATNPYKQTGPYGTNCTWYTWKMVSEKAKISLPGWGNAKNWYSDAKKDGYSVGTTPKANSIVVWGGWTSYGHVGYVESISGNTMYIWDSTGPCIDEEDPEFQACIANGVSEETDKICYANAKRVACKYTLSPDVYGITGFIYLDTMPKIPTPNKDNNTPSSIITSPKSSNASLKDIVLSTGEIPFQKDTFTYDMEVENEIDSITIIATTEDKKAKIEGNGNHELHIGLNHIVLKVIAEDNSSKEYNIQIMRKDKEQILEPITNDTPKEEVIIKKDNQKNIIIVVSVGIVIFIFSFLFIIKKRKFK